MPCVHLNYKNPEASVSTYQRRFLVDTLFYEFLSVYAPSGHYTNSAGRYVRKPRGISIRDTRTGLSHIILNCKVASERIRIALQEINWGEEHCDGCNENVPLNVRGTWKKRDIRVKRARLLGISVNVRGQRLQPALPATVPTVTAMAPAPNGVETIPTDDDIDKFRFLSEVGRGVTNRANVYMPNRVEDRPDMPDVYLQLEGFPGESSLLGAFRYVARIAGLRPLADKFGFKFSGARYVNNYDAYQWALGLLRSQDIHSNIITREVT